MRSVFISSTFKDMQAERDYLHEKIFPRLRRLVGQYGEDIQEVDLRWGVDTYHMSEEKSNYQVLRVCIDAIDRCKPYIIVLLGDRYGWIPDVEVVESLRDERVTAQYEESMSITNLEIKYGALSEEETLKRCIFCFRNPDFLERIPEDKRDIYLAESPEHEQKLRRLKEQIRAKKNAKVLEYEVKWDEERQTLTGMKELGENIYRMMEDMLRVELGDRKAKNSVQQYLLDAQYTKERYLSVYTPRLYEENKAMEGLWFMAGDKFSRYHSKIKNEHGNEHCIHLSGGAGSGKSALIAYLEQQVKDAGAQTILYFSGNPGCQNVRTLKSVLIYRMEEILGMEHDFQPENQNVYLRELDRKFVKQPVFCFIDALDQLFPDYKKAYLDIMDLCPNLFVITSSLDDFPYEHVLLKAKKIRLIEVKRFTENEKKQLIQKTSAHRGKKIDDIVETRICAKEGSGNPLFLSLLLQRLFAMRQEEFQEAEKLAPGMDGLHLYMQKIIEETPEQVTELSSALFDRIGEMFESTFFKKVAYLIALSGTGLSEREIGDILRQQSFEFSQLKFQEILYYLYDVFTEKEDGKWIFAHRIFYEAMMRDMGEEADEIRRCFIDYSEVNPEFMEREGYVHILKSKDVLGAKVLRECRNWDTYQKVQELAAQMLRDDEDAAAYFMKMPDEMDHTGVERLFAFWKSAGRYEREQRTENFRRNICEKICRIADLPAELKVDVLMELLYGDAPEESQRHIQLARSFLSLMQDCDRKRLRKIEIDSVEMRNLFETDHIDEGFGILKELLRDAENLSDSEAAGEDAVVWYLYFCRLFAERSRKYRNEYVPEYLEKALVLCEQHPELARKRRVRMAKIEVCLEATRHYEKEDPYRGACCAKEALELARALSEEDTSVETLRLLSRTLNFYGHDVDREHRYQYRYESLNVCKRAYQIAHTDYWQQEVAVQASFFAKDVAALHGQQELEDREKWIRREREAWDLSFAYFEELCEKDYVYVDRAYYEDMLLERAQEEVAEYQIEQALKHAKRAYDLLQEEGRNVRRSREKKAEERHWLAAALLAENLDDKLCVNEAVPYAYEQIDSAKKLWERKRTRQNFGKLLAGLQIAGRVLYHAGEDEDAYRFAAEGKALLAQYKTESQQTIPSVEAELDYILGRIAFKRSDLEEAKEYQILLEQWKEQGHLDFWMKGQLMLLQGDLLLAEKEYVSARDIYSTAIHYWESVCEQMQRRFEERKWHVKSLFYNLYAVWQKAEAMRMGNLTGQCSGQTDDGHTRFRDQIDVYHFYPGTCREEYRYAFKICMEKAKEKDYASVIDSYVFRTMDRMLELGNQNRWNDWKYMDIFAFLCQMAGYCKKRNLNMDRQLQVFTEALCRYDLRGVAIALSLVPDMANYWIDIYGYIRKQMDAGIVILPCNKLLIGRMWMYFGCFEEADRWFVQIPEENEVHEEAKLYRLYSQAMCVLKEKDEKKLSGLLSEIDKRQSTDTGGIDEYMLKTLYPELTRDEWKILEKKGPMIVRQEQAQRYLHVLKAVSGEKKYFSVDQERREAYWGKLEKVRLAYEKGNTVIKGQEDVTDTWEDRALALKDLTSDGMTWQTDYKNLDEEIFAMIRELYDSCTTEEEKKEIAEHAMELWRNNYQNVNLKGLSVENLNMLSEVEKICGYAPLPALVEERSVRLNDKELLHDFFRKIPEYSCMEEWRSVDRKRKMEVKDIFDRLLAQNVDEWVSDLRNWLNGTENLWIVSEMNFFREADETAEDPKKHKLYEIYQEYLMYFTENSRKQLAERIRGCGV